MPGNFVSSQPADAIIPRAHRLPDGKDVIDYMWHGDSGMGK
jgi:hypothetical protein